MVSLEDLKDLTLYRKQFYLPIDTKNKKCGSAIMLMTPNFKSSELAMTAPYMVNKKYFESYYVEKSITRYIQNESVLDTEDFGEYIFEEALSSKERNDLQDSDFGLPSQRRYPMPDKDHVFAAIRFFNHVEKENEKELAKNIIKKIGEFHMVSEIHVGENNRFKPYWENCALYAKVVKESASSREDVINLVSSALEDNGLKAHISKNSEWGSKNFIDGSSNTLCLGSFNKETWNKAYEIARKACPEGYTAKKDNYFTIFIDAKKSAIEESAIDDIFAQQYFAEFVAPHALTAVNHKLAGSDKVVFNGYKKDIDEIKKYFTKLTVPEAFERLEMTSPKKTTIYCVSDPSEEESFTDDSFVVFTEKAFKDKGMSFSYGDYIKYVAQLYAIYTIDTNKGQRVLDSIAEPAAILLSGIAEDIVNDDKHGDRFTLERVFKYIIDKEGILYFRQEILEKNNVQLIAKYTREFNLEGPISEAYSLLMEEAETISVEDPTPESLKAIQNMGAKLKRRIKQHSIYKLNKIMRDIERGNVGVETRGINTIQQLQTGDVTGQSPEITTENLNKLSNGDYITEGNFVYLFEDSTNYDTNLRKALFKDRFKTNKQVLNVYKEVKAQLPFIKYTYTDIARYTRKNLFVDLSYYNESFFRNMAFLNDEDRVNTPKLFNIYMELMGRLLKDDNLPGYNKKTIFIPILDWRHNNSTKMWIYREDINPISVIYHMILKNNSILKKTFGDRDVIFLGGKNYFKINFSKIDFTNKANITKFLNLTKRIIALGYDSPADPDPEGDFEDSPKGIAMSIVDKIETSQNVSIDNVEKFSTLKPGIDLIKSTSPIPADIEIDPAVRKDSINVLPSTLSGRVSKVPDGTVKTKNFTTRKTTEIPATIEKKVVSDIVNREDIGMKSDTKVVNSTNETDKKDAIVDAIAKVAGNANSVDDALDKLNDEEFKEMILALQNDSEDNVRVDATRASRVIATEDEFHKKEVAGKSVKDLLATDSSKAELQKTNLKVASINEEWHNMTFMNFDKDYDLDSDIVKMLDSMQHWTFPIAIKNIDVKDNSTSEDILDLWTIECVDYKNTKFTLKLDIPRFINGSNFLKLRGNEKTLMIQSALLPIIKTGLDECQIIGSGGYNKIFVRRFGARNGQSTTAASKLLRALNKYTQDNKDIKVVYGDNTKICEKYELPMDYIDISGVLNTIEAGNCKIYFNQDELRLKYEVDDTKGIPIGVEKKIDPVEHKAITSIIYFGLREKSMYSTMIPFIINTIISQVPKFDAVCSSIITANSRCTYSKASILSTKIPVIVICGYLEGLITTLKKANISYQFMQDIDSTIRHSDRQDYIKFADGYLVYDVTYSSSLLLNGLKENDTESYSIKDVNNRRMYFEFLENYGGSIKSDGIENFYDCMLDPITKEILEKFKLPTDFVSVLLHVNNLLADNKYVKHIDQTGRRWRRKEIIAGYFYKALTSSYVEYANSIRHNRKNSKMTIKQSAVIDLIVSGDPSTSDLSINNALNDVECANSVTNKGLAGMNAARAYTINTRGYDDSMLNLLGMDTGFSGNVGINRQATVNANIDGGRGFIKTIGNDTDKLNSVSAFTMTEAITPFGCTHDDPPRTLMTYVQTSKHMIRCDNNDPTLVTTGADEALPYLTSDIFAFKAKKDGSVVELVQEGFGKQNYMIIEYKDGTHEYVNLSEEVKKNSDGGYYVPLKLDTDLKVGSRVKAGDVIAYDKLSFSKSLGESGNLAANIGTLAKVAIINTDEGFEDSAAVTESFANKIGTDVIQAIDSKVEKGSNIFVYKNIGDPVMEGDTLFAYQSDFDDDVVNTLLKNLTVDEDQLSELGRNPIKSKYTGIVENIEIFRTCELDEMSESLRAFVTKYENKIKKTKSVYNKYGIDTAMLPPTAKVPEIGKTKNLDDAVMIIYYIKYNDTLSVGDKIVFYSANKGIIKYIIAEDEEPYTSFRPNEHIDSFMSLSSISGRMTASITLFAATSKLMVELDRSVKDLAGIPYDEAKL